MEIEEVINKLNHEKQILNLVNLDCKQVKHITIIYH